MKAIYALVALIILVAACLWERKAICTVTVENAALRAVQLEAEQLADQNRALPSPEPTQAPAFDASAKSELLSLRNEVGPLRAQHADLEKLRAANQHLAEELKSGHFTPRRLADMDGTVTREKWTFAGFATPEAALQSFFAGLATGDPEQLILCMGPQAALDFRKQLANDPEKVRKDFAEEFGKLGQTSGFRITGSRNLGDNKIELNVQVAADGKSMPLPLIRIGEEWKIGE
jgi:hypothetical protein